MPVLETLQNARHKRIVCIGDIMLDRFAYGHVDRISPEAPIPVMQIQREDQMLGGVGNVARNIASLGGEAHLISITGDDDDGAKLKALVSEEPGIRCDLCIIKDRQTTLKTRFVANAQQLMRVDKESHIPIHEGQVEPVLSALKTRLSEADLILVSDYAKGMITRELMEIVVQLAKNHNLQIALDPKRNDWDFYGNVDLIKPNAKELSEAVSMPCDSDGEIENALEAALNICSANAILVTRSAKGMSYLERGGKPRHLQGRAQEVFDVSGAGDTSLAALGLALSSNASLEEAAELALAASAIAVTKAGTAAVYSHEILDAYDTRLQIEDLSYGLNATLAQKIQHWRAAGLSIGFTNGCFDLLHPGHLAVLEHAKARCDRLVVGLNCDASVKRLKGPDRPINDERVRATLLLGLKTIDDVALFEEDTPLELIKAIQPDLLVKGGDYTEADIVGATFVKKRGGKVSICPIEEGYSTTAIIEKSSDI